MLDPIGAEAGVPLPVLMHLAELRDALSALVKARASCLMHRSNRDTLRREDVVNAWDDLLVRKACDLSVCSLMLAPALKSPVTPQSVDAVCHLKRAFAKVALNTALMRAKRESREVTQEDVDKAWDSLTFGKQEDLSADRLFATETSRPGHLGE